MPPRILFTTLIAFAASTVPTAPGIASLSPTAALPAAATTAIVTAPDPQLARVREAIEAAERGGFDADRHADLTAHALYPWIEYAGLRHDIDTLTQAQAQAFLSRHGDRAVGRAFREAWVAEAARRRDWAAVLAAWTPTLAGNSALRCAELEARHALGRADAAWRTEAQALWRGSGQSLPDACDSVFRALAAQGGLPPTLRWERIDRAAGGAHTGVMRAAARGLPAEDAALVEDYAAFLDAVHPRALAWPRTARSRRMASYGLARLAKAQPAAAEAQLPRYAQALGFTGEERARVLYQIALWSASSYEPEAARRLAAVPESAYDERLHEWRVREALARSDWHGALAAIRKMGTRQRSDSRWQYFEARLAERTGDTAAARQLYRQAADKAEFHGFLAADRIDASYTLCPAAPGGDASERATVENDPAMVRAMGLYRIDRRSWAAREWADALGRFNDSQRRLAVEVAQSHGWFDRAVFALGRGAAGENAAEELRLYSLRFPLHHAATIRREAANNGLDPAWVAAQIRAESVFDPRAHSAADAMGLMQILAGTGADIARRLGLPWAGAQSLYEADTNIVLGTAYLRHLLDRYGGQPYQAIAGYNAGPTPLARWQAQRPDLDPDFWIETITYKETRDYVARVLAFSVLYDWRLNGNALRLSERMRGRLEGRRKMFVCPPAAELASLASSRR